MFSGAHGPSTVFFSTAAADLHVVRYGGCAREGESVLFLMQLSSRLTNDLPNKEALDVGVDFIASRARVGASAQQNPEIKCLHCSIPSSRGIPSTRQQQIEAQEIHNAN